MGRASFADARTWQIFSPGILLSYGVSMRGFDRTPANSALITATALATQRLCSLSISGKPFNPLVPRVTGFCLCLLLRASSPVVLAISAETTPDRRSARILFAVLVSAAAAWLRFARFMPQALIYALFFASPRGLFEIDGEDFMGKKLKPLLAAAALWSGAVLAANPTEAFCGYYVAKADAKLFNKASKVVVARKGEQTAVTMASDYQGDPKEFALVIPVPTVVTNEQIKVLDSALVDHLDAYSAPRLVEYFDPDPCHQETVYKMASIADREHISSPPIPRARAAALGVKIEAEYSVGEYDILILSAVQSDGLATWLTESGYHIPAGAAPVLGSYIKQGMKFFVARVNLQERAKLSYHYLRPIQVTYATEKFMLPIRLGTVNASGSQDMIVLMLTEKGRVEPTNYRTARIPSNAEIPIYTKADFGSFYRAVFDTQVTKDEMSVVYLEYAWDMGWCDPCAADPVPNDKLAALGAFWVDQAASPQPAGSRVIGQRAIQGIGVFLTRLHVRYDAAHFPEDLMFQETTDRSNFQGRYILRHPFGGPIACAEGQAYRRSLGPRFEAEASTLSRLTGWDIASIREKMRASGQVAR